LALTLAAGFGAPDQAAAGTSACCPAGHKATGARLVSKDPYNRGESPGTNFDLKPTPEGGGYIVDPAGTNPGRWNNLMVAMSCDKVT
jgi:hypothetical protein